MLVHSIFLVHLACRLYIALCSCGLICLTELWVNFQFVPRKHRTRCTRETSLCFHRPSIGNYSTPSARLVGPLIICLEFRLAINSLDVNRGIIQVRVITILPVVCAYFAYWPHQSVSFLSSPKTLYLDSEMRRNVFRNDCQYSQVSLIQALTQCTKPSATAILPQCIVHYLSANTWVCNTTCGIEQTQQNTSAV
jgi:hypothetical protein